MSHIQISFGGGPENSPAAAVGTGIRDQDCWSYRSDAASRILLPLPGHLIGHTIAESDEFVWHLFPIFDDEVPNVLDGYRAAAVSLDIVCDDGRRLLTTTRTEVDGTPSSARARIDLDFPDQWNERRVSLSALRGTRVHAVELIVDPPPMQGDESRPVSGWIEAVRIEPASRPGAAISPSDRVQTTRGSLSSPLRSRGLTQPLTGVPHGGIYLAPATDLSNPHWTYSWNAHAAGPHPELAGILLTHAPSIWIGDRSALALRIGTELRGADDVAPEEFRHDDEDARPHRYRLRTLSGLRLDATATAQGALLLGNTSRVTRIVLTAPGTDLASARIVSATSGSVILNVSTVIPSPHEDDPLRGFFSLRIYGSGIVATSAPGSVIVDVSEGSFRIEAGSSQLSTAQASTVREGLAGYEIDKLAERSRGLWDEVLSRVDAPEAADEERVLLASDLYRLFLYPTHHDEETSEGPQYASPTVRISPDKEERTGRALRQGRMFTDNGFWDTYRTTWPAYAFLTPETAGTLLEGMLEHVRDSGWSPRWTAGTPLDAMVGTSLDIISAELVQAGIEGFDLRLAYDAALRNATAPSADPRFGRKGMPESLIQGFVDARTNESVSWTIEGAINDAGAAILAREVARRFSDRDPRAATSARADARYLAHRALAYRSLWDQETRFFRARNTDGSWADAPFNPHVWGGGNTETNAWDARFPAPHDGAGMTALFGGPVGLRNALDDYFSTPETGRADIAGTYSTVIHEMVEARDIRRGMWALSNQPAHHIAWMYAHSDQPWRVGPLLDDALDRLFRGIRIGQGYPGDEDNGEMSAWHLFATMGFAPFAPGSGRMLITPPRQGELRVSPRGAPALNIRTHGESKSDRYIHSVRFNGRPWEEPTIAISDLHRGGSWDVFLGPEPVLWSNALPDRPYFAPDGVDAISLINVAENRRESFPAGITACTPREIPLSEINSDNEALFVFALAEGGIYSFDIEGRGADVNTWTQLARYRDEAWRWENQARPFEVTIPRATRALRLRWLSASATVLFVQVLVSEA